MGESEMLQVAQTDLPKRRSTWWQLLILAAVASLGASLATRVCHAAFAHHPTVRSSVTDGMPQRMDCDGSHWVAPVPSLTFLQTAGEYAKFAPAGPPLPTILFDQSLSNRPPPAVALLA
jgi:hypothetical protein